MLPKVWFQWNPTDEIRERLTPVVDIIPNGPEEQLPGVHGIVVGNLIDVNGELMDHIGPSLKVIARPGIGVDNIDIPAATERGILVIHTPDAPTESTAEHAVALLMSVAKRVVTGHLYLQHREGERGQMLGTEMKDRTLGIVGCGRIGRRVAEICGMGLKMRVVVYDPFLDAETANKMGVELAADLPTLLAQSDFVTLHTPLMPETHHLIGEAELALMKPSAYLINASRGPIVDEAALIRALQNGALAGAALDVFDPEPPEPDNPLLHMTNVVATPHVASFTDRGTSGMQHGVADQLIQIFQGERPPFLVDPTVWPGRVAASD